MHIIPKRVTLVHQVEGILRNGIRSKLWAHHLPGENELCHGLQVSRTTLRAALATLTRERWIRSSQGQRRQITKARETHKPKKSGRVVLVTGVPLDLMGGTPLFLLDDLRNQLAKGGFELEVHASRVWFGQRPNAALERLVRERNPDAWVLFSTTAAIQRWFAARALPCVLAGSCHAGLTLPSVEADFHALGQHAARNLITKILNLDPTKRPNLDEILGHQFLNNGGSIPRSLPLSTLACPPSANYIKQYLPTGNSMRISIKGDEMISTVSRTNLAIGILTFTRRTAIGLRSKTQL